MDRRARRSLLIALVFAVVVRGLLAAAVYVERRDVAAFQVPDSGRYLSLASDLVHHQSYEFDGESELFRPPGYPMLLAIGTWLGHVTLVTLLLQATCGALIVWCCFHAGRTAGGAGAGVAAAVLAALEPGQWAWSSMIVSESLFTALVAAALAAAFAYLRTGRGAWIFLAAAAASGSAYVRVIGYWLPAVVLALSLVLSRHVHGLSWPRRRRHAAAGIALVVVMLGAWHVRNGVTAGYWAFSTQFSRAVFAIGGTAVVSHERDQSYIDVRTRMNEQLRRDLPDGRPGTLGAGMRAEGLRQVAAHPIVFLSTYAKGVVSTVFHPGTGAFVRLFARETGDWQGSAVQAAISGRWRAAAAALAGKGTAFWVLSVLLLTVNAVFLSLAVLGFWRHRHDPYMQLAAGVAVYFLVLSGGPDADSRRRAPLLPALCLLGGRVCFPQKLVGGGRVSFPQNDADRGQVSRR
jgi:4-amino-4-deoxy-L-arabinose transferase-like glycosyltransferase